MRCLRVGMTMIAVCFSLGTASAGVLYNETSGDLSNLAGSPTNLGALSVGDNDVIGGVFGRLLDSGVRDMDPDFFTVTVPAGTYLSAVILEAYTHSNTAHPWAYLAVQAGNSITSTTSAAALWGTCYPGSPGQTVGSDLLPALSANVPGITIAGGSVHFTGPLLAGTYTFWIQETAGTVTYDLNLKLSAVPEPSTLLAAGMATLAGGLHALRRRRAA